MPETVQFYPVDITYKIINKKANIFLFGRTKEGSQICVVDDSFEPYFYVTPKKGAEIAKKLEKIEVEVKGETAKVTKTEQVKKNYLDKEVDAIKVYVSLPRDVPVIRDVIKDWEIIESIHEYDILFTRRYLIDKNLIPLTLVEAEGDIINIKSRVPVLKASRIEQVSDASLQNPKILAVDIETYNPEGKSIDMEKNPIVMIAFYGKDFKKVISWKKFKADDLEIVESEADLIEKFKEVLDNYKPDILTGYYSGGFDLPYIDVRARKYKIKLDIGLDFSILNINRGATKTSSRITGIAHVDVFKFIRRILGTQLDTNLYGLNDVAEELIGEKKIAVELDNLAEAWDTNKDLDKFAEYNLHDAKITYMLMEKMVPNIIELVKIVGLPPDVMGDMGFSQLVEWYIIRQENNFNEIAPENPHNDEIKERRMKKYEGAFVFEPKPGLYDNIVVFDFRSLYPSIISSHNISPGTLNCKCCVEKDLAPVEDAKYWFCTKKKGFIPTIMEDLIERRMRIKEIIKKEKQVNPLLEARSNMLKLLANSFYGYIGFYAARWYSIECARAITAYGRHYIHKVSDKANKSGFEVIYGDTDSLFTTLKNKTKQEALKFVEEVNLDLPGVMELNYEAFYPSGLFVSAKVGSLGAKKKYALLKEDGKLKIRGFETVRRNWSLIAKESQEVILKIILKEKNKEKAFNYIKKIIKELLDHKVPVEKVTIYTQLQKEISSYDSIGPHVAIATKMRDQGMSVGPGSMIKYVISQHGDKIRDKAKFPSEVTSKDYDPYYYINNQVVPAVEKIFEVLGYSKEELLSKPGQKKLDKFFK